MTNPAASGPSTMQGPPRLDLFMTVVRVARWETTVRWYIDVLGLEPVLLDACNEFALLSAGNGRVALQGTADMRTVSGAGRVRLVFQVDDLDRARQRLIDLGMSVDAPFENLEEGYRELRIQGPEGLSLRLFAWTDPARGAAFGDRPAESA